MGEINLYQLSQFKKPIGVTLSSKFPFRTVGGSPGPAAYAVPPIEHFRGKSTPKFTIASAGDRLKERKADNTPGPGDYMPPKSRSLSTLGGVMSCVPRLQATKPDNRSPGPGAYPRESDLGGTSVKFNSIPKMDYREFGPGPGQYKPLPMSKGPSCSFSTTAVPPEPPNTNPGPGEYLPNKQPKKRPPAYSITRGSRAEKTDQTPGPVARGTFFGVKTV
mmetsp:Transcript_69907/g.167807  ORF Transcript_69907/g.167807 Transcript_69907/m.167807 type:complete len:219 (+) Transcript_69907:88-744(+)